MLEHITDRVLLYLCVHGGKDIDGRDDPLSSEGMARADDMAAFLHFGQLGRVISSDLLATMQTASVIAADFERNPALRPSCNETFDDFMLRWAEVLRGYVDEAKSSAVPLVLVTHNFNVSATAVLLGEETDFRTLLCPGGIAAVRLSSKDKLYIEPMLGRLTCSSTTTPKS